MTITIKKNLHGYYVDTLNGAMFFPEEMLDFIEEQMGSVETFVTEFNRRQEVLRVLKEAQTAIKVLVEQPGFPQVGVYASVLTNLNKMIYEM